MKTVKELVEQATWETHGSDWFPEDKQNLQTKVELAINEAIEQCAKICDRIANEEGDTPAAYDVPARNCAIKIRALKSQ